MTTNEYSIYIKDQQNDWASGVWEIPYLEYFFDRLAPSLGLSFSDKLSVLDIGPGMFYSHKFWADRYPKTSIVGIDLCLAALAFAKEENLPVIEGDAHYLSRYFGPESFDFIYAFHSLEHMYNMPLVLKGSFDILKSGGIFYYSVPIPSVNFHRGHWFDIPSIEAMDKFVSGAGYKVLYSEVIKDLRFRPEHEMVGIGVKQ